MSGIQLGSTVTWSSQSGGFEKAKTGAVVEVVAAGARPDRERFPLLYRGAGVGYSRDHVSYVVHVPGKTEKSAGKLYWPRAAALRLAEGKAPGLAPAFLSTEAPATIVTFTGAGAPSMSQSGKAAMEALARGELARRSTWPEGTHLMLQDNQIKMKGADGRDVGFFAPTEFSFDDWLLVEA